MYIADSLNGGYLGRRQDQGGLSRRTSGTRDWQPQPAADKSQLERRSRRCLPSTRPMQTSARRDATFSMSGDISGECYATVDRGSVELTPLFDDLQRPISLHEGQSALTGLNVRGDPMVLVGKGEMPAIFARQMPKDLPALSIETIRDRARQRQKKGALPIESGAPIRDAPPGSQFNRVEHPSNDHLERERSDERPVSGVGRRLATRQGCRPLFVAGHRARPQGGPAARLPQGTAARSIPSCCNISLITNDQEIKGDQR